eukprot:Phypoly_transcript_09131.p1 GENE.Phypoly_transcript_09131~~Phypoly_transcript_09131.p1  ORF type:complete len:478 (+),score=86.85 Phypoly_transcript_09131:160-1434(+)
MKPFPASMIWSFPSPPPTPLLLRALASVLNNYPILCASLCEDARENVTLRIDNANPVAFFESSLALRLAEIIPDPSLRYSSSTQPFDTSLIPTDLTIPVPAEWKGPSVYIQWTKLACGGCFLGLSGFHCILDAQTVSIFVSEWARRARAIQEGHAEDSPAMRILQAPVFDPSFFKEGMEDALRSNPVSCHVFTNKNLQPPPANPSPPPKIISRVYHFPRTELEAIRHAATPSGAPSDTTISVFDALYAHMMQVICKATGTISNEAALICMAYNGRRVFSQPHFFGSAAFWLAEPTTFSTILSSLPEAALAVHHVHASQTHDSLLAFNACLASFPKYSDITLAARITTHDLHTASWRNTRMYDVDFGTGTPTFAGPSIYFLTRYMLFLDAPRGSAGEGGVDVCLALEEEHWKQMMDQGLLHGFAK